MSPAVQPLSPLAADSLKIVPDKYLKLKSLYQFLNERVFDSRLPVNAKVEWSTGLKVQLAVCARSRQPGRIRVNRNIVRGESRDMLIDVLLHEMIHLEVDRHATKDEKNLHGRKFTTLMNKINKRHKRSVKKTFDSAHISKMTEMALKHRWRCNACDFQHKKAKNGTVPQPLLDQHAASGCQGAIRKLRPGEIKADMKSTIDAMLR
jgi:predicted SprT family Zn-dependent metalloprotease